MEAKSVGRVLLLGEGEDDAAPVCLGRTQRSTFPHTASSEPEFSKAKVKVTNERAALQTTSSVAKLALAVGEEPNI